MTRKKTIPADARVGSLVKYKRVTLKVALSQKGCRGCVFQAEAGARFCEQSKSCFAHMRPDRKSVKFIHKEAMK